MSSNDEWKTEKFYEKSSPKVSTANTKFEGNSNLFEFMDENMEKDKPAHFRGKSVGKETDYNP